MMDAPTPPPAAARKSGRVLSRLGALFDREPVRGTDTRYFLIDFLRGLAAVCVLMRHYQHFFYAPGASTPSPSDYAHLQPLYRVLWPLYDQGQYAVQMFWMISGFVFSGVYATRPSTTRNFVLNRFARLYPLHLLTLLTVTGLQAIARARHGAWWIYEENTWPYFLLHLFFASNWSRRFPFTFNGPVWSVSVEVIIYAAFWVALPVLFGRGVVVPLAMALLFSLVNVARLNDFIGSCGIYFFGGSALYVMHDRWRADRRLQLWVAAVCFVTGCVSIAAGGRTLLSVSAFAGGLILAAAALETTPLSARVRPLRWLGESSYGMYLWHTPIQLGLVLLVPAVGVAPGLLLSPWFLLLFLGLVMAVGRSSFLWFESPVQRRLRAFGSSADPERPARPDVPMAGP